ncbi:MAG: L-aspartate oxidase [Saprospiraceae bacterium]|nr:L-aspartate oxidase [Saprospiraceae bacterium]
MKKIDVLVIGSGVAGLTLAIKMAERHPDKKVCVLTKTHKEESNTRYAQGGVAAVWNFETDSFEKHIADTLDAGDDLCDKNAVEIVITEGPKRVKELIEWGTRFDKNIQQYDLGREGGHSENRVLHYKDLTGWEIQRALNEKAQSYPNLEYYDHYFAIDLITQHHLGRQVTRLTPDVKCFGAYVLNSRNKEIETFLSKVTVIATGGAGQVYKTTTNPSIATGDGMAMAYRAMARMENMEFVQFHPTSLFNPAIENPAFLVSEAVRGFGAILKTPEGDEFMEKYDPRKSLAPRDIVARAIDNEMKMRGQDFMSLDCRHLEKDAFIAHFPTIYEKCISLGIDPMKDLIPVVPAAHYICGGVKTNEMGRTSVKNLYACGECSCTGLHGANRLASNSLLEGLVFAERIVQDISQCIDSVKFQNGISDWDATGTTDPKELVLITQSIKELKEIMSSYVGIVRTNIRAKRAFARLHLLYQETERLYTSTTISPQLCELRNLITVAYLITKSAAMRKESRGLHFTTDFPHKYPFLEMTLM